MSTNYLFDTSAWIEFFQGTKEGVVVKELLESDATIITPDSCIAEIYVWCLREQVDVGPVLQEIRSASHFQEITVNTWIDGAHQYVLLRKTRPKIGLMDSLIIALQKSLGATIVTKDNDFRNLPGVVLL